MCPLADEDRYEVASLDVRSELVYLFFFLSEIENALEEYFAIVTDLGADSGSPRSELGLLDAAQSLTELHR